jgi:hypothetical protein
MDPITSKVLFQIEVNCISNCVWETVKCIGPSLEAEDDDSDNDLFYIPPSNLSKPISTKLEAQMVVDHGRRHSCITIQRFVIKFYILLLGYIVHLKSR